MKSILAKVGRKKDVVEKNTPILPISGWMGDNLLKKSENMTWWKGMDVECGKGALIPWLICPSLFAAVSTVARAQPLVV